MQDFADKRAQKFPPTRKDDAVREAYGFPNTWSELETVGRLVEMYEAKC